MAQTLGSEPVYRLAADDPGLVTEEKILQAVELIVSKVNPVRIVAFGSRARGTHHRESDLDIAVIVDRYDPQVDKRPVWRADIDVSMSLDLLVYDLERQIGREEDRMTVQGIIKREGLVLYDRETGFLDRAALKRLV